MSDQRGKNLIPITEDHPTRVLANGQRIRADRRKGETDDELARRLSYGRMDELCMDYMPVARRRHTVGTAKRYRSDINCYIIPAIGDRWLVDCREDAYLAVMEKAATTSRSVVENVDRTLSSMVSWALEKKTGRWPGDAPFGGPDFRRVEKKGARTGAKSTRRRKTKIRITDCPIWNDTVEFGAAFGDAAAERWGPSVLCLRDLHPMQYATGTRIAEAMVLHSRYFHPNDPDYPKFTVVGQYDREGHYAPGRPPGTDIKGRYEHHRDVGLWESAIPFIDRVVAEAIDDPARNGYLFAPAGPPAVFLKQLDDLYREVADAVGYRHTPHMHRHSYASYNLAGIPAGGYGLDIATVADWLRDTVTTVMNTYVHGAEKLADGWSPHLPGQK